MTPPYAYADLRPLEGKRVVLLATTGERIDAIVDTVFEEERDLSYRLLHTTRPETYSGDKAATLFVIPFEYIAQINLAE